VIKKLVNDKPLWDVFCKVLDENIAQVHRQMEQETSVKDVYRCQGEIQALRKLYFLRDKVNGPVPHKAKR
jgi:hypothetical protein